MSNYYAISRIEALENAMFSKAKLQALIGALKVEQEEKILSENGYKNGKSLEEKIAANQGETIEFLIENCSSLELKAFFLIKRDFTALKRILKSILLDTPLGQLPQGNIKVEELKEKILKNFIITIEPLNSKLVEVCVAECFDAYEKHIGNIIDIRVDKAQFEMVDILAKKSKVPLFQEYAKREIFYKNLKMLCRVRLEPTFKKVCEYGWIEGGHFSQFEWQKFVDYDESKLDKIFEMQTLHIKESYVLMKVGKFKPFERAVEAEWEERVRQSKLSSSSDEKILAYSFAKEFEYRSLKRVIIGKRMGVSHETLLKNLRGQYA
ncbi:MAG: V-type ATPase subunit [Fusobacteria bacterium]|nr:V-type ATPase subunit [Fusobacteriota bacterium]